MLQSLDNISDDLQNEWHLANKIIDLLAVALSALAIFRFWFISAPLVNIHLASLSMAILGIVATLDWLQLHFRRSFFISSYLMPNTVLGASCVGVWAIGPSMFLWILVSLFSIFVRLPLKLAQVNSLLAVVLSITLMSINAEIETSVLVRSALSSLVSVTLLSIFFKHFQQLTQRLSQTSATLHATMQMMSQGISVIGDDGRCIMVNDKACELLNIPKSLILKQPPLTEVIKFQSDQGELGSGLSIAEGPAQEYVDGQVWDVNERKSQRYLCRNRSGQYVEVDIHRMPSGDVLRTYTDVTKCEEVNRQLKVVLDEYQTLSEHTLQRARYQVILALTELSAVRDNETGLHTRRTQLYVKSLAHSLVKSGQYAEHLSEEQVDLLVKATPMHDLGKVGIPDNILLKPGQLTMDEWRIMQTHCMLGESILLAMAGLNKVDDSVFVVAAKMAGSHHESWDGSGYPRGLSGQSIPLSARLMALADVYDALTTARVYKHAWTHEEARDEILSLDGVKLDPLIVAAFLREEAHFVTIARELRDKESDFQNEPAVA